MSEKPKVPKDTKLLPPPDGVDEGEYWTRVRRVHYQAGMPWHNACKIARQELVGARHEGGPTKRAWELPPVADGEDDEDGEQGGSGSKAKDGQAH